MSEAVPACSLNVFSRALMFQVYHKLMKLTIGGEIKDKNHLSNLTRFLLRSRYSGENAKYIFAVSYDSHPMICIKS